MRTVEVIVSLHSNGNPKEDTAYPKSALEKISQSSSNSTHNHPFAGTLTSTHEARSPSGEPPHPTVYCQAYYISAVPSKDPNPTSATSRPSLNQAQCHHCCNSESLSRAQHSSSLPPIPQHPHSGNPGQLLTNYPKPFLHVLCWITRFCLKFQFLHYKWGLF